MIRFDNPFDISKDGQNPLIDGIRIHIRASADNKERIIEFTVSDEHDILDWIRLQFRG